MNKTNNIGAATCAKTIIDLSREFNEKIKALQAEYHEKKNAILSAFAKANARFKNGDIISTSDRKKIIRIETVSAAITRFENKEPGVNLTYTGTRLNEDLSAHWDNCPVTLHDINKELIKIDCR